MTRSSHDRPDSASAKRATLFVVAEQNPLLYQFIENNQYLWTKAVKDFVEAALRDGNLPVVLEPSPRTRPKVSKARAGARNAQNRVAVGSDAAVADVQPPHEEERDPVVTAAAPVAGERRSGEVQASAVPTSPEPPDQSPVIGSRIAGGAVNEVDKARLKAVLLKNLSLQQQPE